MLNGLPVRSMKRIDWMEKYLMDAEGLILDEQVDEGLAVLNSLLYDEPGYGSLHNHLGWAYFYHTEDLVRAELHLKMAIQFDESFATPYLHLGMLYIKGHRYKEAIHCLQSGLTKADSNRVALLQNLAQAHELLGQWRKAIRTYKEALAATVAAYEADALMMGIKRCRRKRIVLMFRG